MLKSPILIGPVDGVVSADPMPTLSWLIPDGDPAARYDFVVEIAEDPDFTKNVRRFNSFDSKLGFSFQRPVAPTTDTTTVSFRVQSPLVQF